MDRGHLYPAENANGVCLPLLLSTRFHRNGIQHFSLEQPLYKKVHTLLGDLNQHIIIIINIIVITILQKVRVSFMFRDHYRPNPFLPQLRASYFHPRILFSSFACFDLFLFSQAAETFKEIQITAEANTNTNYTKLQNALKVSVLDPG